MKYIGPVLILTAALSAVSWTYRFIDEHSRFQELFVYILVPGLVWLTFAGSLMLLRIRRRFVRAIAVVLLVPTTLLWAFSVLVGFQGLKIH